MWRSIFRVVLGFVLAVLTAGLIGMLFKFPFASALETFEPPFRTLLRWTCPLLPVALPLGIAAILAGESQRWRHWYYWAGISALIGLCGFLVLTAHDSPLRASFQNAKGAFGLMAMGLAAGHIYWWLAGHRAGLISAALAHRRSLRIDDREGRDERQKCWLCNILGLLLGLLPLLALGWYLFHKNPFPSSIIAKVETDATERLKNSGLKDAKFTISDHVGHVTGTAPDSAAKAKAFEIAKLALAPYVGIPGVVAALQNDIDAPLAPDPSVTAVAEANAKKKADDEAAAKKKAEAEAALKKKAEDEAAAKKKADDEAAAKKKAADEAASKKKADDEAAAKKKTDNDAALKKEAAEAAVKAPEPAKPAATPAPVSHQAVCASDLTTLFLSDKIRFALNSAELSSDISGYLDKIASLAKGCENFQITIDGHADRSGNEIINDELADDRAESVRAALVERGVPADHLITHGYGEERPFDPGNNREAYRQNRRVDLGFKEQSTAKN